jgi:hypothetical protein
MDWRGLEVHLSYDEIVRQAKPMDCVSHLNRAPKSTGNNLLEYIILTTKKRKSQKKTNPSESREYKLS